MHYQIDMTGYKPEDVIVEMHEAADAHQSPYVVIHGEHNDKTGGLFLSFFSFYRLIRMSRTGGPARQTRSYEHNDSVRTWAENADNFRLRERRELATNYGPFFLKIRGKLLF